MISILAQTTPPPASLASWLEVFFYVIGGIAAVVGLLVGIKTLREEKQELPQPLTVKEHKRYATYEELEAVRRDVRSLTAKFDGAVLTIREDGEGRYEAMNAMLNSLRTDIKADNQTLHGRITELLAAFAEFKGRANALLPIQK